MAHSKLWHQEYARVCLHLYVFGFLKWLLNKETMSATLQSRWKQSRKKKTKQTFLRLNREVSVPVFTIYTRHQTQIQWQQVHLNLHEKCHKKEKMSQLAVFDCSCESCQKWDRTFFIVVECYTYRSEETRQAGALYDQQGELCHWQSIMEGLNRRHRLVKSATQTAQSHYGIYLFEKQKQKNI